MGVPLRKIESDLLRLPRNVREHLAEVLQSSLEDEDVVADSWDEEAERRWDQYLAGEIESVPAKEALAQLRARVAQRPA